MFLKKYILESLFESRIDSIKEQNPKIPSEIIDNYVSNALPNDKKHIDWVIKQHKLGNITPDTASSLKPIIDTYERHKSLIGKSISSFDVNGLKNAVEPYLQNKTKSQKINDDTITVHDGNTLKIQIHKSHISAAKAATLPFNNSYKKSLKKAKWCVSIDGNDGSGGNEHGKLHFNHYTKNGSINLYTIHNKKTGEKSALIYYKNTPLENTQFQNEVDRKVARKPSEFVGYYINNPEFKETKIGHEILSDHQNLKNLLSDIPTNPTDKHIDTILSGNNDELKHTIIQHPNVKDYHINKMLDTDENRTAAIRNNNIKQYHITHILNNNPSAQIVSKLAYHPKLNDEHLKKILTIGNEHDINNAFIHPNMTDEIKQYPDVDMHVNILSHQYKHLDDYEQIELAQSDYMKDHPKLLHTVINGDNDHAITELLHNSHIKLNDTQISNIISNPKSYMSTRNILDYENTKPHHFREIYNKEKHNYYLINHPNTPVDVLTDMTHSDDPYIVEKAKSRINNGKKII